MGFTSEAIFFKPGISEGEELGLLKKLGLDDLVVCQESHFEEIDLRGKNGVYIGHFGDCSFIFFNGIVANYIGIVKESANPWEHALSAIYPNKEFLSILNFESTNSYAYHYFKEGVTIRKKMGTHWAIYANSGEELELEKEYYVKKEVVDGQEVFFTKPWNDQRTELDEWTHDQIGGSVAFHLVEMITGVEYADELLFNAAVRQYLPEGELEMGAWDLDKYLFKRYPALIPSELIGLGVIDELRYKDDPSALAKLVPRTPIHINYPSGFHPVENNFASILTLELDQYPQQVWDALIRIKEWDEWFPQIYYTRIVSTDIDQLKPRSRFRWNTLGMDLISQVIDFDPPRAISWVSKGPGITSFHAWQIMPTDSGSKITLEHTQKGWLSQLLHFFLPKRMEKYHLEWLECLQKKFQENP